MPERVLVTGGAGFIGSHLVELLVTDGYQVSIIDDLSRGRREWLPDDCELHEIDIRDGDAVLHVVREAAADLVVHLAALHFIPAVDDAPDLAWSINVGGTENLVRALLRAPPQRLLFASTAAVYPDVQGAVTETTPPGPIDLYGRTKLRGEELVRRFHGRTGATCTIARIFNVIGLRETNAHVVVEIVRQLNDGAEELALGNVHPSRDFTDVRDTAAALYRLLLAAPTGLSVFNVGSGRAVSVQGLVREFEHLLGHRIAVRQDGDRIRTIERASLLADVSALIELGWRPRRRLSETLRELVALSATARGVGPGAQA
jgi:UDP-glucose 4-epimerase